MLHGGGTPGFSSVVHLYPEHRLAVILLANQGDRVLDQLALDVAGMVDPTLARKVAEVDPDPVRSRRLGEVVRDLLEGGGGTPEMTPALQLFLRTTTGKGNGEWLASHGPLTGWAFAEAETIGPLQVLRYRVVLGEDPYWFSVALDREGRIAQITSW